MALWRELPFNYQIPISIMICVAIVLVIRSVDQWMRSFKKDFVALTCYTLLYVCALGIIVQSLYLAVILSSNWVQSNISLAVDDEILFEAASFPSLSILWSTPSAIVFSTLLTWWLGKPTIHHFPI